MITEASVVLDTGLRGVTGGAGAHFKQVTIVIPGHWDPAHCRTRVVEAVGGIAYQVCSNHITVITLRYTTVSNQPHHHHISMVI